LLYSAHGVSPEIRQQAEARQLRVVDATCPLVTKVHLEAIRYARDGYHIVLIGHEGHDEVIGTMGEAPESITLVETPEEIDGLSFGPDAQIAYLTQTTLSVEEAGSVIARLKERYPHIVSPPKEDICYATTNRQEAVTQLAPQADVMIVLGSQNSSNSQRLKELGETFCDKVVLVDGPAELDANWFEGCETVLITAGASAPEIVVEDTIAFLKKRFGAMVDEILVRKEHVQFQLPRELKQLQSEL
jgi:4-hydroxy-3-methylbut-2-enyl diphosphate reductase